ncbi:MAG TPA: hypothetical protein VK656_00490, partial [Candidatus Acidoferrum sp.]|nr:hypothetical protein [Candidatus Acidoferrum sp.]
MTSASTRSAKAPESTDSTTPEPRTRVDRGRAARRAPADLPFVFPDLGLATALGAERSEPAWLREERLVAAASYEALPIEKNQLYTTYVDLRSADLFGARPYTRTASAPEAGA